MSGSYVVPTRSSSGARRPSAASCWTDCESTGSTPVRARAHQIVVCCTGHARDPALTAAMAPGCRSRPREPRSAAACPDQRPPLRADRARPAGAPGSAGADPRRELDVPALVPPRRLVHRARPGSRRRARRPVPRAAHRHRPARHLAAPPAAAATPGAERAAVRPARAVQGGRGARRRDAAGLEAATSTCGWSSPAPVTRRGWCRRTSGSRCSSSTFRRRRWTASFSRIAGGASLHAGKPERCRR